MGPGTYIIYCKPTRFTYVGSSGRSVTNRWSHHIALLNAGTHGTKLLQEHWDKYGSTKFAFRLIRSCPGPEALSLEQQLLDSTPRLYNIAKIAGSSRGLKRSVAVKKVLSEKAKERNAQPDYKLLISTRAKRQHADGALGVATWSAKSRATIAEKAKARTPETSAQFKALWKDEKFKAKFTASRWTAAHKAAQAERIAVINANRSDEDLAAQGARSQQLWKTTEFRAKITATWTPEKRAAQAARMQRYNAERKKS